MASFSSRITERSSKTNPLSGLKNQIESAYQRLIGEGRRNEAFRLREAERRFEAGGAKSGLNSFARARNLANLQSAMNASRGEAEARLTAEQLKAMAGVAGQEASMMQQQSQFDTNQAAQLRREQQQQGQFDTSLAEQQRQSGIAEMQNRNRLNAAQIASVKPYQPSARSRSFSSGRSSGGLAPMTWQEKDARARLMRDEIQRTSGLGGFTGSNFGDRRSAMQIAQDRVSAPRAGMGGGGLSRSFMQSQQDTKQNKALTYQNLSLSQQIAQMKAAQQVTTKAKAKV